MDLCGDNLENVGKIINAPSGTAVRMYGEDSSGNLVKNDVPIPTYRVKKTKPVSVAGVDNYNTSRSLLLDIDEDRIAMVYYKGESPNYDITLKYYNTTTDVWSSEITLFAIAKDWQVHAFIYNGYIYFICGSSYKKYQISNGATTNFTANSIFLNGFCPVLIDGLYYGYSIDNDQITTYTYNPATDTWNTKATRTISVSYGSGYEMSSIMFYDSGYIFTRPDIYDNNSFLYKYDIANDTYSICYMLRDLTGANRFNSSYYRNIIAETSFGNNILQLKYNSDYNLLNASPLANLSIINYAEYQGYVYKNNNYYMFSQYGSVYDDAIHSDYVICLNYIENIDLDALIDNLT